MKSSVRKACVFGLNVMLSTVVHAAGSGETQSTEPRTGAPVDTGQADGRVKGQGSTGGMQPSTPGGRADSSADSDRPSTQGSAGGRQPVTPGGGLNKGSDNGESTPPTK